MLTGGLEVSFSIHGIALLDFYIVSSFSYKNSKQGRVPTLVWLFCDDATSAKGPGCDEGTKGVRELRGYFGPPMRSKNKSCSSQVSSY